MAFIEWTDDLSVLEQQMDDQHQILIGYVNEFHDGVAENASREELQEIYDKLISFTEYHFRDEEKLMQQLEFPDYAVHKQVHIDLLEEAIGYQDQIQSDQPEIVERISYFLKIWLCAHIKGVDKKYAEHLQLQKKAS